MTDAILCTQDFQEGKPVFGLRIEAMITVTHPDGRVEELSGGGDLCEAKHAKPFLAAIEYLRAAGRPPVIVGQVEPPKVPNAITAAVPAPSQERDTFMCGKCMERVPYMSRGSHARKVHECKVWDIAWTALFDISGWPVCVKCGLAIGTPSGMLQHEKNAGEGHLRRAEPYHWDASDMQTTMGEALARAAGK